MRIFKLHHHKHTGKLIHHRHTSYPMLLLIVGIVGVLIFMTGRIARADDLVVTAVVPAPVPSGAPAFTAPADGTVVQNPNVRFEGTCPVITPAVFIALYEGNNLLGSGACQPDGTFQITASISVGTHTIVATVVTVTNQTGQSSQQLTIAYRPVTPPSEGSQQPSISGNTASPSPEPGTLAPLTITSEKPFVTFGDNTRSEWSGRFSGGRSPYTVTITWGDGDIETRVVSDESLQSFFHAYRNNRLYTVTVTLKDQSGLSLTRFYAAMNIKGAPKPQINTIAAIFDFNPVDPLFTVYIVYASLILLLLFMWRYEHIHYARKIVGIPLHYHWQKARRLRRPKSY